LGRLAVWRQMPKKSFGRGQNPKAAGYSGSIRADNVLVSSTG
ncbi:8665_t:CDS:1, partial [Rhizophagus irregularis]